MHSSQLQAWHEQAAASTSMSVAVDSLTQKASLVNRTKQGLSVRDPQVSISANTHHTAAALR